MTNHLTRPKSEAAFNQAKQYIPGGVNSPARAFGGVGGSPVFIDRADGPFLYDIDGNRYLDFIGSWGPHILGHRLPVVNQAIETALLSGTSYGAPTLRETEMAEFLCRVVPSLEMVRLVNSGTEATMSALRVARGYTGRNRIIKFAGCYHGHVDSLLVQAGSGALTLGNPSSPGIPPGCTEDTLVLEYNSISELKSAFENFGKELAAVILEPVVGNMGVVIPDKEFLTTLRDLCTQAGTILIFDEVMTGFRVAFGGAQSHFHIQPDMTTLGKIIGAGMPVGAYGGRREIMQKVSPSGPVYQAGTLSGNPVATAAGLALLKTLEKLNPYPRLEAKTTLLADGIFHAAKNTGHQVQLPHIGSMITMFFTNLKVKGYAQAKTADTKKYSQFFHGMLNKGYYLPCSQFESWFVSDAVSEDQLRETIKAIEQTLAEISP